MPYENAHAALIDGENIVNQVIVIPHMDDDDAKITDYCNSIGLEGRWVDTSYIGSRRGQLARIGDYFDEAADVFVSPEQEIPIYPSRS